MRTSFRLLFFMGMMILGSANLFAMEVRVLQWDGYLPPDKAEEFKAYIKKTKNLDITFKFLTIVDESMLFDKTRLGDVDLLFPGVDITKDKRFDFMKKKLVMQLDLSKVKNASELAKKPETYEHLNEGGKVYGIPYSTGAVIFAYDSQAIQPKSMLEVFSSANKNKVAIVDFSPHVPYLVGTSLGKSGEELRDFEKLRKDAEFKQALQTVATNFGTTFEAGSDTFDQAKNTIGFIGWGFALPDLARKTKGNWQIMQLKGGTIGWIDNMMVSSKAMEKAPEKIEVVYELMNFLISKDFQREVVVRRQGVLPVNPGALEGLTEEEEKVFSYLKKMQQDKITWLPSLTLRERNGFQKMWDEAKAGKLVSR